MLQAAAGGRGGPKEERKAAALPSQEAVRSLCCFWDLSSERVNGYLQSSHGASRPQGPGLCPDAQGGSEGKEWREGDQGGRVGKGLRRPQRRRRAY